MSKDRHYALKAMGRCVVCGKNKADKGYTTCLVCRMDIRGRGDTHSDEYKKKHKEWLKRRRDIMYAFGVCVTCGKRDADPGSSTCGMCKAKARQRTKERRLSTGIIPREILWDGMHCAVCGSEKLKPGFKVCDKHYEILRNNMLNARSHRKEINWFEKQIKADIVAYMYRKEQGKL